MNRARNSKPSKAENFRGSSRDWKEGNCPNVSPSFNRRPKSCCVNEGITSQQR